MSSGSNSSSSYTDRSATKDMKNTAAAENHCDTIRMEMSISLLVLSLNPVFGFFTQPACRPSSLIFLPLLANNPLIRARTLCSV